MGTTSKRCTTCLCNPDYRDKNKYDRFHYEGVGLAIMLILGIE